MRRALPHRPYLIGVVVCRAKALPSGTTVGVAAAERSILAHGQQLAARWMWSDRRPGNASPDAGCSGVPTCQGKGPSLNVLFVCTGNICRSPTAEKVAAAQFEKFGNGKVHFSSAGTRALVDHPIHHYAARVLDSMGVDSSGFLARQLSPKVISTADLVLAMTLTHRAAVLEMAPSKLHKTFTLFEAAALTAEFGCQSVEDMSLNRSRLRASRLIDVRDPIGHDLEVFSAVGRQIVELMQPVVGLCISSAGRGA